MEMFDNSNVNVLISENKNVGSEQATIAGAAGYSLNVPGVSDEELATSADETDVMITSYSSVNNSYYVYNGGNATISAGNSYNSSVNNSYSQVNFATDLTGFDISDGKISISSSSGTLTIQNARGQYMRYAYASGTPFAYSYVGSGSSYSSSVGNYYSGNSSVRNNYNTIDERNSYSYFGVIVGGDNVNDSIVAGSGGSSLWGGNRGNDTLVGNSGYDEFIYKLGSGNDVIQNASNSDLINLNSISISQITSLNVSAGEITANFSDGGSLKIQGTSSVGIRIADATFAYNHSSNTWYTK